MSSIMQVEVFILISFHYLQVHCELPCFTSDWNDRINMGYYQCNYTDTYIQGFEIAEHINKEKEGLDLIKSVHCCLPESPWSDYDTQIDYVNWISYLDESNQWAHCPAGYFLGGYYRNGSSPGMISDILAGRCSKPADHPLYYGACYEQSLNSCFDGHGLCSCQDDYLVTGLYKGGCDELRCMQTLKCCRMADKPEELTDLDKVKVRVMSRTRRLAAELASYLGYGWCAGCTALYCGESFVPDGDVWRADTSGHCEGYKDEHRLAINYSDWGFSIKSIKYSDPVVEELPPEIFDSGVIFNNDSQKTYKFIERSGTALRRVTHIPTSSWRNGHELGLSFSYTPIGSLDKEGFYKFNYETAETTTDENDNQRSNWLTVRKRNLLKPYTGAKWKLLVSKTRTSVSYTATIQIRFSLQLQGFLISGGGFGGENPNYHYLHQGSGSGSFFNYTFGDKTLPFYTALKREYETDSRPWLWNDLINTRPDVYYYINELTNEELYEFQLTGTFIDVVGDKMIIRWSKMPSRKIRRRKNRIP